MPKNKKPKRGIADLTIESARRYISYMNIMDGLEDKFKKVLMEDPRPQPDVLANSQTDLMSWSYLKRVKDLQDSVRNVTHAFTGLRKDLLDILEYHDEIRRRELIAGAYIGDSETSRRKPPL